MEAINQKYEQNKLIDITTYSLVLKATHIKKRTNVAIKLARSPHLQSIYEAELRLLQNIKSKLIPKLIATGFHNGKPYIITPLYGQSLQENLDSYQGFSIQQVHIIANQLLQILKVLHMNGWTHNDIKPDNILFGRNSRQNPINLIDYGFSIYYSEYKNHQVGFRGNLMYCSKRTLIKPQYQPRDDLESLAYLLKQLYTNFLPWFPLKRSSSNEEFIDIKLKSSSHQICKGAPNQFIQFWYEIKQLKRNQEFRYDFWADQFYQAAVSLGKMPKQLSYKHLTSQRSKQKRKQKPMNNNQYNNISNLNILIPEHEESGLLALASTSPQQFFEEPETPICSGPMLTNEIRAKIKQIKTQLKTEKLRAVKSLSMPTSQIQQHKTYIQRIFQMYQSIKLTFQYVKTNCKHDSTYPKKFKNQTIKNINE